MNNAPKYTIEVERVTKAGRPSARFVAYRDRTRLGHGPTVGACKAMIRADHAIQVAR